jgi:ABC-type cobalamin/Fe3+-siderophores transport system ATPase subunit
MHLARHWCRWRTLILDDPVQHIDDYRAMNLVEVLCAIRRDRRQIICAVEDPALADLLCRRLRASKHEAGARVTLEPGLQGRSSIVEQVALAPAENRVLPTLGGIAPPMPDGPLSAKI